jgi:hypothetical protein
MEDKIRRTKTVNAFEQDHIIILKLEGTLQSMRGQASIPDAVHLIVEWFVAAHPEMFPDALKETKEKQ